MNGSTGTIVGKKVVRALDWLIDLAILLVILLMVVVGTYALWDSHHVYDSAQASQYSVYRPTVDDTLSFAQLRAMNPEVIAWITIYGTKIDYPITHAADNEKYLNTDAEGNYSLAGSIFLHCNNSGQFNDFNSIIFGHHMSESAMFGDLDKFADREFFDSHEYGELFCNDRTYGIEFFAFLSGNAYDMSIYQPAVAGKTQRTQYLNNLVNKAMYQRNIGVSIHDQIVLLSTCTSDITNGRQILVGRLTNEIYPNRFETADTQKVIDLSLLDGIMNGMWHQVPSYLWLAMLILLAILLAAAVCHMAWNRRRKRNEEGK